MIYLILLVLIPINIMWNKIIMQFLRATNRMFTFAIYLNYARTNMPFVEDKLLFIKYA